MLIDADGRACISDFGLSTILEEIGSTFATTSTGKLKGTLRWAAPELLDLLDSEDSKTQHTGPTMRSDIYSFGGIMLQVCGVVVSHYFSHSDNACYAEQILSGKVPYHYYSRDMQIVAAIFRGETPARPDDPRVTDRRWGFIQRCWSIQRPSSDEIVEFSTWELSILGAQSIAPAALESRRSRVSSSGQAPTMGRPIKTKPRKISRLRDPNPTRGLPVVSPYRVDCKEDMSLVMMLADPSWTVAQRNWSASRKKGREESEGIGPSSLSGAFSSPQLVGGKSSPHSSVNSPSPPMSVMETSQHLTGASPYNYTGAALPPFHVRSLYEYGIRHPPLASSGGHQGDGGPVDHRTVDMYASGSPPSSLPYDTYEHPSSVIDPTWYNSPSDVGYTHLSTTPPTLSFAGPGLSFLGLDYVRNYNSSGHSAGVYPLWQKFDAGPFGIDPELPVTFGESSQDLHEVRQPPS